MTTEPRAAATGYHGSLTEPRATVSCEGPAAPIVLTVEDVVVPLTPTRALALAVELTQRAVLTIKVNQFGPGWPG